MNLEEYIKEYYPNNEHWFIGEVSQYHHVDRINKTLDMQEYLDGKRKNDNLLINIDGRMVEPTKIKLNFASILLDFNVSFLFKNPVSLISDDVNSLKEYQKVYKKGKFKQVDAKLYRKMKYCGQCFEYLYFDENENPKSKVLAPESSYPVYSDDGRYIAFIYHFMTSSYIEYYTVYYKDRVEEYSNLGGTIKLVATHKNYSGLPICYRIPKETNILEGKSEVAEWKNIIDNLEKLSSKYQDALYKFITGIPVMTGTKLAITKDGKGALNPDVVGYALQLEEGSTFDFKQNKTDFESMKLLHDKLFNYLTIASCVPAVSLNAQDVSNLSETSIRMMYQLAIIKAGIDSQYMLEGFYKRWEQIGKMINEKGINITDDIECEFIMEIPQNSKEVIENLKSLREMSAISLETILAKSPYTIDINSELNKLEKEKQESNIDLNDVDTNLNINGMNNNTDNKFELDDTENPSYIMEGKSLNNPMFSKGGLLNGVIGTT